MEFLAGIWPPEHLSQLAPRAALQCRGSAFQSGSFEARTIESQLPGRHQADRGYIGRCQCLGKDGSGGQVSQKSDESNESYVARHEVLFEDLIAQGATLNDMRAYLLLRNSALSSDDKKRVVVESQGNLKYDRVVNAIRMLGAKFFHEVQGQQKTYKAKTYDVNHVQESDEECNFMDENYGAFTAEATDLPELAIDEFLAEGDEDALVVQQFEDALIDAVQGDGEMGTYMSTYLEARKRLTEKVKSRGFWPLRGKGLRDEGQEQVHAPRQKPLGSQDC